MKFLAFFSLITLLTTQAHAMFCYGETYSGKKVGISFGTPGAWAGGDSDFRMTNLKISINGKVVSEITKNVLIFDYNHDQILLSTKGNMLPSVKLVYNENTDREDRASILKVNLPGKGNFSFKDVVCE